MYANIIFHLSVVSYIVASIYYKQHPPTKKHLVSSDRLQRIISLKCPETVEKINNILSKYYVINDSNEIALYTYTISHWKTFYINDESKDALKLI
jgi:hypothetical protein